MADGIKEEKQYGLVVPSKHRLSIPKPGNVFGEESGSDADDGTDWVRKALRAEGEKNLVKKQTQLTMNRALKQDPTVYQYDEVYDDIERSKVEEKTNKKTVEKKAKYIENLLKAAERRKREQEHRVERMVQKEREAEGAMFADKESFVTSAYRAKLEEFKQMEEEEKRMDILEAIGDVTKQQDISGFYRHLYHQTVDPDKKNEGKVGIEKEDDAESDLKTMEKISKPVSAKDQENPDGDDPLTSDSDENSDDRDEQNSIKAQEARQTTSKTTNKRQYRKRMTEESQSSSENESEVEKTLPESSKAGIIEDQRKEETPEKKRKLSSDDHRERDKHVEHRSRKDTGDVKENKTDSKNEKVEEDKSKTETSVKKVKKILPEVPKVSIWEKRTVGPVFEAALERYYARKAARSSG